MITVQKLGACLPAQGQTSSWRWRAHGALGESGCWSTYNGRTRYSSHKARDAGECWQRVDVAGGSHMEGGSDVHCAYLVFLMRVWPGGLIGKAPLPTGPGDGGKPDGGWHGVRVNTPDVNRSKADPAWRGHIVNLRRGRPWSTPNMGVYNASKHAVVSPGKPVSIWPGDRPDQHLGAVPILFPLA